MWLVTGVLKESTGRGSPSADALYEGSDSSPQVAAALQSLKTLVGNSHEAVLLMFYKPFKVIEGKKAHNVCHSLLRHSLNYSRKIFIGCIKRCH